jgi:hypothetical protein
MFKRLVALTLLSASFAAHSEVTIVDVTLFNSQNPSQIWITSSSAHWILGVSDRPNGPILNAPDSSVTGISQGNYWLFADPAILGSLPQLHVNLSDGTALDAIFQVQGVNGTEQSWTRLSGSPTLSIGWAQGTVDLVGRYGGVHPNGINDLYMAATLGPVPEPAVAAMLLMGLVGVALSKRAADRTSSDERSVNV